MRMDFEFSIEEKKLIKEVREFIEKEATPELLKEAHESEYISGGPESRKFTKKFAEKGWLTPSWPKEWGGLEASEMITYIIRNEMAYARLPIHYPGAHMCGPTILRFGSEGVKNRFLLPIAKGEIEFCVGYSEPGAGSDLMSLEMHAEDKGDHYLVNGQKTFNTHAHVADYHWLAVRTNLEVPKHKGISILIVDMKSQGITVRPMYTMAGTRTNEVFYDNVEVPKENLVGKEDQGVVCIMNQLDYERMFPFGHYKKFFEDLVAYAKKAVVDGNPISKNPFARQKLAQLEIELSVLNLLYYRLAHLLENGKVPSYQSSMEKVFYSDFCQNVANKAMEILGLQTLAKEGDSRAVLDGIPEWLYRQSVVESIYAGSSEIQLNIIAQRGLGLPR